MHTGLIDIVEATCMKKQVPYFEIGDTVDVVFKIKEGDKERTQVFTGTVIARKGRGINQMVTVRRVVGNEGVERIFPIHSPSVLDIKPVRSSRVRRAKLYFLRERSGKSAKLRKRHTEHTAGT